jgi:hypothetical protein
MVKLCEKKYLTEIDSMTSFKITNVEYIEIINAVNECTDLMVSISQTLGIIQTKFMEKNDVTEIMPTMEQLEKDLPILNEIALIHRFIDSLIH